jgi:Peptidase A4 family
MQIWLLALAGIAALACLPAAASAHPRSQAPKHKFGRGTSTNWSGWDVPGSGATHVIGTWTQPPATCGTRENSWSSPWVGIDGDTSNTVEQIGTDTDCSNGTPYYYAWYEMYPKKLFTIGMSVSQGDSFTGEVTSTSPTTFVLKLRNNSTGASFQTTQTTRKAQRSSAEWIMEGPSSGLLTNFGTVGFSSASATINGQTASLGSLSNAQPITMVTSQGTPRAVPSGASGGSFSVSWQHG